MKTTFLNTILSNNTFYLAAFVSTFHFELEQVPGGEGGKGGGGGGGGMTLSLAGAIFLIIKNKT